MHSSLGEGADLGKWARHPLQKGTRFTALFSAGNSPHYCFSVTAGGEIEPSPKIPLRHNQPQPRLPSTYHSSSNHSSRPYRVSMSREQYQVPSTGGQNVAPGRFGGGEDSSRDLGSHYLCGDCGIKSHLTKKDPIRCKQCGCRVLYKSARRGKNLPKRRRLWRDGR
jgi:DNA-directed RNA polymerases I, II, and III subunit RPABC4